MRRTYDSGITEVMSSLPAEPITVLTPGQAARLRATSTPPESTGAPNHHPFITFVFRESCRRKLV